MGTISLKGLAATYTRKPSPTASLSETLNPKVQGLELGIEGEACTAKSGFLRINRHVKHGERGFGFRLGFRA